MIVVVAAVVIAAVVIAVVVLTIAVVIRLKRLKRLLLS